MNPRPVFRPFHRFVQANQLASGATLEILVDSPFSRGDVLRVDHVLWIDGESTVSPLTPAFDIDTDIEGLEQLRGSWPSAWTPPRILPTWIDLPGNVHGRIRLTNRRAVSDSQAFGLFCHMLRNEKEEESYRPVPPFRAWAESTGRTTVAVTGTGSPWVPILSFDAPLVPGGILLTHLILYGTGSIRHDLLIEGDGFANVQPLAVTLAPFPVTGHLFPGRRYTFSVRRNTLGTSNIALCLYGHELAGEL